MIIGQGIDSHKKHCCVHFRESDITACGGGSCTSSQSSVLLLYYPLLYSSNAVPPTTSTKSSFKDNDFQTQNFRRKHELYVTLCDHTSKHSPPTPHRDSQCHILFFHFRLLNKVLPLAEIEMIISAIFLNSYVHERQ